MTVEQHKENLKKYIEEDVIFREPIKNMSDFDKYCYNHCKDIEAVLTELDKDTDRIDELINEVTIKDTEINKLNNVIDRMAEYMYKELDFAYSKEMVIEHFMKEDK